MSPVFVTSICNSCQIYQTYHLHCNLPSFVKSVQPDYLSKCVQIICQADRASKLKVKLLWMLPGMHLDAAAMQLL